MKRGIKLDTFQRVALLTTAATYGLIAVGALVRASGAGLGCPDWPKCFERWYPPLRVEDVPATIDPALFNFAKAWTEYVNRLLGVLVGFLILGTLALAIRHYRRVPRVLWPSVAAFVLVGLEGAIGGKVVSSKLSPIVLTVHLIFALSIVSLLLYATVSAFFPRGRPSIPLSPARLALGRASVGVAVGVLVQVGVGAALRGEVQLAAADPRHLERAAWLRESGLLLNVHQSLALLVGASVVALVWLVYQSQERDPWLRRAAQVALMLVGLQAAAGFGLARFAVPPVLQVVHLALGTLLLGALTILTMLAYRLDPRRAPELDSAPP